MCFLKGTFKYNFEGLRASATLSSCPRDFWHTDYNPLTQFKCLSLQKKKLRLERKAKRCVQHCIPSDSSNEYCLVGDKPFINPEYMKL